MYVISLRFRNSVNQIFPSSFSCLRCLPQFSFKFIVNEIFLMCVLSQAFDNFSSFAWAFQQLQISPYSTLMEFVCQIMTNYYLELSYLQRQNFHHLVEELSFGYLLGFPVFPVNFSCRPYKLNLGGNFWINCS